MTGSRLMHWILCCLVAAAGVAGCSTDTGQGGETGSLSVDLVLAGGIEIDQVGWEITGNGMDMSGNINVSAPGSTASVEVFGLPPGETDYTVTLTATSTDEKVTCEGSAPFNVEVGQSTDVMVMLNCKKPRTLGGVRVNGKFNICTQLTKVVVSPLQTSVGNDISLSAQAFDEEGDAIHYIWTGTGGSIADPSAASTTYTCQDVGEHSVMIMVTDNDVYCRMATWTVPVTCVEGDAGDLCEDVLCEDDGNECTVSECNPANGACETSNVADGTACDGGAGTCSGGQCVEVDLCEGVDCNDNNECTADACNPADGTCSSTNVDDGTPCNNDEGVCSGGSCVDVDLCEGVVCDDTGNECTVAMCNNTTGECDTMNVADGTACNGGVGACSAGVCIDNNPCQGVDCTSDNDCVQDGTCDPADGLCDPGDPQPADTACDLAGTDDGFCDGAGACVACNADAQCPDDGNECTAETCTSNACSSSPIADGTMCDNDMGVCDQGTCVPADLCEGVDCSDGNECTQDLCDPATGNCSNPAEADGTMCVCPICGADGLCDMGVCVDPCDGVDCSDGNQCTADLCNVGVCSNPNVGPGAGCDQDGGNVCDGAGTCVECINDGQCAGTDICTDNTCGPGVVVPDPVTKAITLGCTNNLTTDISVLPWEMEAAPQDAIVGGQAVSIDFTGTAVFTESFLDAGLAAVPGLNKAAIAPGNRGGATVVPKAGLTGGDASGLELEPAPVPLTCSGGMRAGLSCVTAADCPFVGYFTCSEIVDIPTIDGTGDACAACDALGDPKDTQCAANGFCIAPGGLPLPLENKTGSYTAAASGAVLLGWDETNQTGLDADGAYIIPAASFSAPWQPGGLRVVVGILQIALNCVMAVEGGVDTDVPPDGMLDGAAPTPNEDLISFAIQ